MTVTGLANLAVKVADRRIAFVDAPGGIGLEFMEQQIGAGSLRSHASTGGGGHLDRQGGGARWRTVS